MPYWRATSVGARRQALRRNRLLLLSGPAATPLAARNQLNPWNYQRSYDCSYERSQAPQAPRR